MQGGPWIDFRNYLLWQLSTRKTNSSCRHGEGIHQFFSNERGELVKRIQSADEITSTQASS